MRQNLLETYGRQIKVAEAYVAKNYDGKRISANTALTTAVLLDNTNKFLTEAFEPTVATNHGDLGAWKKFCLNLTNIAVPSLIANDLVIVHPMTSISGSVAYLEYVSKTDKGNIKKGDRFNGVFDLGNINEQDRIDFTSQVIIENGGALTLTPVANGRFDGENYRDAKCVKADGSIVYGTVATGATTITWDGSYVPVTADKVAYVSKEFQMEQVPAEDIPTIGPKMNRIPLVAEPRRIAVKYDQITAFQAKQDYGFSLDKQIAEQACGELAYEIDSEIVNMLYEAAEDKTELHWSKTLPVGVSKFEHYNGFLEVVEIAKSLMFKTTRKFHPNFMVIAADVMNVLRFVDGFTAAKVTKMNGPYKVGELDGLKVYVSPLLGDGEFFFGLNGSDMLSAAGVYAPYMAIVPTQLLGTPDGGLAQGFSTYYAKAILNKKLLLKGKIVA